MSLRACFVVVAVLAGSAAAARPTLPLSRTGAAPSPCPEGAVCAVDATREIAGFQLVVHHQDADGQRLTRLRIGAVDVGLGMGVATDGPAQVRLEPGTLEDSSAAVSAVLEVGRDALVTVCRLGAPACTRQVAIHCGEDGCPVHLRRGVLVLGTTDGHLTYQVTSAYLSN